MTSQDQKKEKTKKVAISDSPDNYAINNPTGKLFSFLEILSKCGVAGLTDIANELDVPKTTLFRITSQLEKLRYIQREPGGRKYSIAPRLISLSSNLVSAASQLAPRHEILERLSSTLGESCSLGIRLGHSVVYINDVIAESPLAFRFETGVRTPLYCTSSGKILLAFMSKKELNRYLNSEKLEARTPNTIIDKDKLRDTLTNIKKNKFASSQEEFVVGVVGAAVPVMSPKQRIIAVVAVSIPVARMEFSQLPNIKPKLLEAAEQLEHTFL